MAECPVCSGPMETSDTEHATFVCHGMAVCSALCRVEQSGPIQQGLPLGDELWPLDDKPVFDLGAVAYGMFRYGRDWGGE